MRLVWLILLLVTSPALAWGQTCSLTITNMDFGAADLLPGTTIDSTANLTLNCSGMPAGPTTMYCLALGPGSGVTSAPRRMTGPSASTLTYGIYVDGGRTASWGSRSYPTLGAVYGQGQATATVTISAPLYGRIAAAQSTAPTGSYSSTLTGADVDLFTLVNPSTDCNAGPISAVARTTATFSVLAAPAPHCTVTTTDIYFGNRGLLNANYDANGTVTAKCTSALSYNVGLSNGVTGTGPTARKMTNGANVITYGLYRDAARGQPWGATIGTNTVSSSGTGLAQAYTVYGRVPSQTTPPSGGYTDTVNVTVTY